MRNLGKLLLPAFIILQIYASSISIIDPPELAKQSSLRNISAHISPIGFRPLSGRLEGKVVMADPIGACSMIGDMHDFEDDIFIMADDSECLESVKAKNIASSGGYVGIIKQNINNTLHDKEVNLVHIPIVELSPQQFDTLAKIVQENDKGNVTLSIDFTEKSLTHKVNFQVWFSPTEISSYTFLLAMKDFLLEQNSDFDFSPHYVLQSQRESKNYIGCYSSGKYCPTEIQFEGKSEGTNIVQETLRQIIVWKISSSQWWAYVENFYKGCLLENPEIFMNSDQLYFCAENSLLKSGVDLQIFKDNYDNSFLGNRKFVDDNTYLLEERQYFAQEQITSHPIGLINKKAVSLQVQPVQDKICKIQGDKSSGPCQSKRHLSSKQIFIIISVIFVVFVAVAALYRIYIHISMRREIKGQVDKTLEQYYRYIQTFQGADGEIGSRRSKPTKEKSRQLTEELEQMEERHEKQVELPVINEK